MPRRALLVAATAVGALLLAGTGGAAWTTNLVELDNGTCGANLQTGSDRTASSITRPTFFLRGDGGLSSYAMAIDGVPIGSFYSTGQAVVCVQGAAVLAEGPHVLTGTELAPHAGWTVGPLAFSVDTVAPAPPSTPVLSAYKDSGALGDGITRFRSVNVTGTAAPNESVQVLSNGITTLGGARADANGNWSVTTVTLADGAYTLSAQTIDTAGNRSVPSATMRLTIDSVPPPTPDAPTLAPGDSGYVVSGTAGGDAATVLVYGDGVHVGAAPIGRTGVWQLTLPELPPGPHSVAVAAADLAGNTSPLSAPLGFAVAEPAPPASPDPPAGTRPPAPPATPRPQGARPAPPSHNG
jgi:hypothetical protein